MCEIIQFSDLVKRKKTKEEAFIKKVRAWNLYKVGTDYLKDKGICRLNETDKIMSKMYLAFNSGG